MSNTYKPHIAKKIDMADLTACHEGLPTKLAFG